MLTCEETRPLLDAYIDDELADDERAEVEAHVDGCAECRREREEVEATREALRVHFGGVIASAPRPRAAAPVIPMPRGTSWFRPRNLMSAAALIVIGLVFAFYPRPDLDASPEELVQRAADRYLELEDAELWVTVESEAIELIAKLVKDDDGKEKQKPPALRVLMGAPNRLLVQSTRDLRNASWTSGEQLSGFDGERFWTYDAEQGVVEVAADGETFSLELGNTEINSDFDSLDAEGQGLLSFLSWGFVRQMSEDKNRRIEERTGPSDERAGRRVFEVNMRKEKAPGKKEYLSVRGLVTIDPRKDFMEKMIIDVNLGGLSLVTITIEVATTNEGVVDSFFRHESHVPEGTPVVIVEPDDEDREDEDDPSDGGADGGEGG